MFAHMNKISIRKKLQF